MRGLLYVFLGLILSFNLSFAWKCENMFSEIYWKFSNPNYVLSFGGGDLAFILGQSPSGKLAKESYAFGQVFFKGNFDFKANLSFNIKRKAIVSILYAKTNRAFVLFRIFKNKAVIKVCDYQGKKYLCKEKIIYKKFTKNKVYKLRVVKRNKRVSVYINNRKVLTTQVKTNKNTTFRPFLRTVYSSIYVYDIKVCADKLKVKEPAY